MKSKNQIQDSESVEITKSGNKTATASTTHTTHSLIFPERDLRKNNGEVNLEKLIPKVETKGRI